MSNVSRLGCIFCGRCGVWFIACVVVVFDVVVAVRFVSANKVHQFTIFYIFHYKLVVKIIILETVTRLY